MLKRYLVWIALATSVASTAQANLLTNSGFETGDFTGWTVGGTTGGSGVALDGFLIAGAVSPFVPAYANVRSGSYAGYGAIAASPGEFLSLSQSVMLGGGSYTAGFYMGNDSQSAFGIDNAILAGQLAILVDGASVPFSIRYPTNNFPTGSTPADMYEFAIDFAAVAGSHQIEYRISGSGTSRAGISVDDFYLIGAGSVPEPGTLALLGLSLAGLAASRRRKK